MVSKGDGEMFSDNESMSGLSANRARHMRNRRRRQKYKGVVQRNALMDTIGSHLVQTYSMDSDAAHMIMTSHDTTPKGELDRLFNPDSMEMHDTDPRNAGIFGWKQQKNQQPVTPPRIARHPMQPESSAVEEGKAKKAPRRWGLFGFRRGGGGDK